MRARDATLVVPTKRAKKPHQARRSVDSGVGVLIDGNPFPGHDLGVYRLFLS